MPRRKPWYKTLFERDYYDYWFIGGPRGSLGEEEIDQRSDAETEFIVRALELPEGARVLDLCCGHGRHSIRLAQRGYRVAGLDLSTYHLRLAKAAARKAGVRVEWVHGDMRKIPPDVGPFDAVINVFTSFGYFEKEADDQRVLDGVGRALKPGGRFFIDTINRDFLMRYFRDTSWEERADGGFHMERRRYDIHTGRINVDWFYVTPDGERRHQPHSERLYTFTELSKMLHKAGLTVRGTWGGFDGQELSMESRRTIVLSEKDGGRSRGLRRT